ncbi:MAG TPA: hypothetical protein VGN34_22860 [Ktedonobacteraceae bacterium]
MTLSKYIVELQDDHKHLSQVSHPRLADTPFRSPQFALFDLGPCSTGKPLTLPPLAANAASQTSCNCRCSTRLPSIWLLGPMEEA